MSEVCEKGIWDAGWMTGLREGREESSRRIEDLTVALTDARNMLSGIYNLNPGDVIGRIDGLLDKPWGPVVEIDLMAALKASLARTALPKGRKGRK